ncbi:ESX secretion-associated protein EspG [Lentzea sp. NBRC 105346]|uniref:ESX secretion-associated protein EspG n=1 Tax=Lentzea sp. NBRC 105346 TaxID=3032205 RepID=UPI0024A07733|nr:ESX secretion-associated protein EspG [Lentzea sp. NBRC 105346]GLZ27994.1 ESX secretion-associated protein EspG [Lentzea sp. NBRC 105346]
MTATISLSTGQFDAHWAALGLGRKPYPLDVPHTGRRTPPDADTAGLLRLLADHVSAVDVVGDLNGPLRAVAVTDGRHAGLAVVRDDEVLLQPIRPTALTTSLLSVLPPVRAGSGRALSAPLDVVRGAGRSRGHDVRQALLEAGLSRDDAVLLSELATGRTAGGQFGATHRGVRAKTVITWFDTTLGRYLVVSAGGWLSVAPADSSRIASRIEEILAAA